MCPCGCMLGRGAHVTVCAGIPIRFASTVIGQLPLASDMLTWPRLQWQAANKTSTKDKAALEMKLQEARAQAAQQSEQLRQEVRMLCNACAEVAAMWSPCCATCMRAHIARMQVASKWLVDQTLHAPQCR